MANDISFKTEYAVAAVRVSTLKQRMTGDSPEDQQIQIERHVKPVSIALNKDIKIGNWFRFTESGSGELDEQPIREAIEWCKHSPKPIRYFFIKSIDRFTRGGSIIYGVLKLQLSKLNIMLIDTYGVIGHHKVNTLEHLGIEYDWSSYSPTYVSEILEAERAHREMRDILTRLIGAEIRYVRLGYTVRKPPFGLVNVKFDTLEHGKRVAWQADPDRAKYIRRIFDLRIQGSLTDKEIVIKVNEMGYKSKITYLHDKRDRGMIIGQRGGKELSVKQLQQYIQNPAYAGINIEKWTESKPVRVQKFSGVVSIDEFNQANRGKIFIEENGDIITIHRNKPEKWRITKRKENPDFPYKQFVMCPNCKKPLLGSAPRSKTGRHIPTYHCARNHKYWGINKTAFDTTITDFCSKVKLSKSFINKFRQVVLEEWEKRRDQARNESVDTGNKIIQLQQEKQTTIDKMKYLDSPVALKSFEVEVERLEFEIAKLQDKRNHKEHEEVEIQTLINYCQYYMEHLKELLLEGSNPLKDAAMFGLIFDQFPYYEELNNGK